MQRRILGVIGAVVVLHVLSPSASAQRYRYYGGYIDNRASTPAESYARGMADVVRSSGMANLLNSEAAKKYEEARSMNLDNRLKYAQTYYERRKIHDQYRAEKREQTREYLYRRAQRETNVPRLTPAELDPVTGELSWPPLLRESHFDEYRKALDKMFSQREIALGAIGLAGYTEIQETIDAMVAVLKEHIREYPPALYTEARNFLTRLENEAKHALE